MKSWKFLGAPLTFMLLTGMPWCIASAADDTTDPVTVNSGEHVIVGNVTVENHNTAVDVRANSELGDKDASAKVNGNVTLTNNSYGYAVYTQGYAGKATAEVTGNISVNADESSGVSTRGNPNQGVGMSSTTVGGDVSAKGQSSAYGADLFHGDSLSINGNVTSEAQDAQGLSLCTSKESIITVGGNVSATGKNAVGVEVDTLMENDPSAVNLSLTVGNGITANSNEAGENDGAAGISVNNNCGAISIDINGDVTAKSELGKASAIEIGKIIEGEQHPGTNDILIHGNLISDGMGIYNYPTENLVVTNILVENEIQAKTVGILNKIKPAIVDGGNSNTVKLNLTVWKIAPNENGNVAEFDLDTSYYQDGTPNGTITHGKDEEIEKSIMYIIKVEQPGEGGTIKAVDANGNALTKSFGFDIAHEGEKVVLKANLAKEYKIVAAYNGLGEKVPLLKDENGNYYIIVPKGGGVYLSVELEEDTEHHYAKPDNNENTINDDVKETEPISSNATAKSVNNKLSSALKTGDSQKITPWLWLSVVSIGAVAGMEFYNKKRLKESI